MENMNILWLANGLALFVLVRQLNEDTLPILVFIAHEKQISCLQILYPENVSKLLKCILASNR